MGRLGMAASVQRAVAAAEKEIIREYQARVDRVQGERDEAKKRCRVATESFKVVAAENQKLKERLRHVEAVFMDQQMHGGAAKGGMMAVSRPFSREFQREGGRRRRPKNREASSDAGLY